MVLILYTTLYRTGGDKFERAARTLEKEKLAEGQRVICKAIESKQAFLDEAHKAGQEAKLTELHFIGHSGMYGIMFGTTKWPEQFSPFEWKQMKIPFAENAKIYFHACRTGRWFAPYVARTLGVQAFGHYWYTTVSAAKDRFKWERGASNAPVYIISCPGRKSHGLFASLKKYSGQSKAIPMLEFSPSDEKIDTTYDSVAGLYDDTFVDIGVREDEWRWLSSSLPLNGEASVLDIGCGNGALLAKLAGSLGKGTGVDISAGMIAKAKERCKGFSNLSFTKIDGPTLPFPDNSFDAVTSVLSFRYLDWDPILQEILRVLKPGGEFLVVDMVAAPTKISEWPKLLLDKLRTYWQRISEPGYFKALSRMVRDPRWQNMLKYNPMRAEHEYRWYLESRFPGQKTEVLNVGWSSRILAFRSGPVQVKSVQKMAYP